MNPLHIMTRLTTTKAWDLVLWRHFPINVRLPQILFVLLFCLFVFFSVFTNRSTIQWKSHRLWYWWINEWINNFHTPLSLTDGQRVLSCATGYLSFPVISLVSSPLSLSPLIRGNLASLGNSRARWRTKQVNLKDLAKSLERCKKRTVENGLFWFLKKLL